MDGVETPIPTIESHTSPEVLAFSAGFAALHPRLLMAGISGKEVLNSEKKNFPDVTKASLGSIDQRSYQIFSQASFYERQVSRENFEEEKQKWIQETVNTFEKGKSFFSQNDKGKRWAKVLDRLGINASEFNASQAEKLYDTYLRDDNNGENLKKFVKDIISSSEYNLKDHDTITWIGKIFGKNSAFVITHLVFAEKNLQQNPDLVIKLANEASGIEKTKRINNVETHEAPILKFLYDSSADLEGQPTSQPHVPETPAKPKTQPTTPEEEGLEQAIISGRGFEVVEKIGWPAYREALAKLSYKDIITYKLSEIEKLEEAAKSAPPPLSEKELEEANKKARETVQQMRQELPRQLGTTTEYECFDAPSVSKLVVRGKNANMNALPLTRLYFHTYNRTTPEAYMALFEALRNTGAIQDVDLSLYYENFTPQDDKSVLNNNNIIIYVPGQNPQVMKKVAQAVRQAKQSNPAAFALHPQDEAHAKTLMLYNFNIPADDTTGFVEMPSDISYDTTHRIAIGREFYPNYNSPYDKKPLKDLLINLLRFIPGYKEQDQRKFTASKLSRRRKHMPALLFEEAVPELKATESTLAQEISLDEAKVILSKAIVIGEPKDFFRNMNNFDEELLEKDEFLLSNVPKYKLEYGDTSIYLPAAVMNSSESSSRSRHTAIGFVEKNGSFIARIFYRSNSQGEWRLLPAFDSVNNWLVKGYNESSLRLPFEVQQILDNLSGKSMVQGYHFSELEKLTYQAPDSFNKNYSDFGKDEREITGFVEKAGFKLKGNFYYDKNTPFPSPYSLVFSKDSSQAPDFSKPIASWETENELYGPYTVDSYLSKDGQIKYSFCRDRNNRAWVAGAELVNSEVTQSGVKKQWIDLGVLTTPAYEYQSKAGGYGNKKDIKNGYIDMFDNYLSHVPVILEYLRTSTTPLAKAA